MKCPKFTKLGMIIVLVNVFPDSYILMSYRDSAVGIATGYGLDD
jgi:hypothetical protein